MAWPGRFYAGLIPILIDTNLIHSHILKVGYCKFYSHDNYKFISIFQFDVFFNKSVQLND